MERGEGGGGTSICVCFFRTLSWANMINLSIYKHSVVHRSAGKCLFYNSTIFCLVFKSIHCTLLKDRNVTVVSSAHTNHNYSKYFLWGKKTQIANHRWLASHWSYKTTNVNLVNLSYRLTFVVSSFFVTN